MTEKQERILESALQLFAKNGYNAVSTSKVARKAGVSEGLVFRHFRSKEGLLNAIMEIGRIRIIGQFAANSVQDDPKAILRGIIEIPFNIRLEEYDFWRLLYMMKWQNIHFNDSLFECNHEMLVKAFNKLNYDNPKIEAEAVMLLIDGIAINLLMRKMEDPQSLVKSIFEKYEL